MACQPIVWAYCSARITRNENFFLSFDQSECEIFCKMSDADGFVGGETLDIFLGMLDESDDEIRSFISRGNE